MRKLLVVMLVIVLLSLAVAALAQGQAPAGGGGGGGGMRGGGMRGGGFAPAPVPVMMTLDNFIFVELGGYLYKIDPAQMKVVGVCFLSPPGAAAPMAAPPAQ